MIETIRKKISVDKSRSHTSGILPYIRYGGGGKYTVSMNKTDGNWGNFPMDIAIAKEETVEGDLFGFTYKKFRFKGGEDGQVHSDDTNRMKYATIMTMYNEIQKILDKSVYTKAVRKYADDNETIVCEEQEDCSYEVAERSQHYEIVLSERFSKVDEVKSNILTECNHEDTNYPGRYEFIPVPSYYFTYNQDGVYRNRYFRDVDEDEDITPVNDTGDTETFTLDEGRYYVIMPDYETYRKYEDYWVKWWLNIGEDRNTYFPLVDGEFLFCRAVEKYIIGKIEVPQRIEGIRVPEYVYYTEIEKYKNWFEKNGVTNDEGLSRAAKDIVKEFNEMGGFDFYNFLCDKAREAKWITSIPKVEDDYMMTYVTPYISVPISLEDNHEYGGIYENYLYSYSEAEDAFVPAYSEFEGYEGTEFTEWYVPDNLYCESMLCYVMDDDAREVEGVTGTWSGFTSGGQMYAFTYSNGQWTYIPYDGVIPCGDGETPGPDGKYRSITTFGVVEYLVPQPVNGTYYFLVKKYNDEQHPFDVPYTEGSFHDMRETDEEGVFIGNYITSIAISGDEWTIQYVIGGLAEGEVNSEGELEFTAIDETGVKYEESYVYHQGGILKTFMDGVEGVRVYYNWIDTEAKKENVYSEEYRLYRKANKAKVIGMRVGGMLTPEGMIKTMVFTRDGSDSLPDMTKDEFNVALDRGNAAAFEKYFKLSECNTFEDLQNYGNNFYNLE